MPPIALFSFAQPDVSVFRRSTNLELYSSFADTMRGLELGVTRWASPEHNPCHITRGATLSEPPRSRSLNTSGFAG